MQNPRERVAEKAVVEAPNPFLTPLDNSRHPFYAKAAEYPILSPAQLNSLFDLRDGAMSDSDHGRYKDAIDQICLHNLRLLLFLARTFTWEVEDFKDAVQDGYFGLRRSAEMFDPVHGVKFSAYARKGIRNEIKEGLRKRAIIPKGSSFNEKKAAIQLAVLELRAKGKVPTIESLAEVSGYSIAQVRDSIVYDVIDVPLESIPHEDSESFGIIDEMLVLVEGEEKLTDLLEKRLTPRQTYVLIEFLALVEDEPRELKDIGRELGISKQAVHDAKENALKRLRLDLGFLDELYERLR